jgi:hypothetical protein
VKDTDVKEDVLNAVVEAAPWWLEAAGEAAAESLPAVKFAVKLFQNLTEEKDPARLGHLACTLAYQQSITQAIAALPPPSGTRSANSEPVAIKLKQTEPSEEIDFNSFSYQDAAGHPFVRESGRMLEDAALVMGYDPAQRTRLVAEVQSRFVVNLKTLLAHGSTRDKLRPFAEMISLGTGEKQAYRALLEHAEYQRWLFEERPVLDTQPFALAHVYIETECGELTWGDICGEEDEYSDSGSSAGRGSREKERLDPFHEKHGGRRSLLEAVLDRIRDPKFNDAIVIQGIAGSGKSAFTLRLCAELVRQGLRPIRVQLRDLEFDRSLLESLGRKIRIGDDLYVKSRGEYTRPRDILDEGRVFDQVVRFGDAEISPYVLVLDGWDEVSISASEGFKARVDRLMEYVRNEFLRRDGRSRVRVVLTGRPSATVMDNSPILREATPVLTIRPLRPEALEMFVGDVRAALAATPSLVTSNETIERWTLPESEQFSLLFERYRQDFPATVQRSLGASRQGSLEVLGMPLLALLALRLLGAWGGDPATLVENPTTLLRSLVDLTCGYGGNRPENAPLEMEEQVRLRGNDLRDLLRGTAAAMSVYGAESIAFDELEARLRTLLNNFDDLQQEVKERTKDDVLHVLMISFFFKGGRRDFGCEFHHKSFREYLFAEAIVEVLKEYARTVQAPPPPRQRCWEDFSERSDSERFRLSRRLSELLAPHWLTVDVVNHLRNLIHWEIDRSEREHSPDFPIPRGLHGMRPLELFQWEFIRDGLADLWQWWAEGAHLRPQVAWATPSRTHPRYEIPYAFQLIEWEAPQAYPRNASLPQAVQTTTIDAQLGEGLFRLCVVVHHEVAIKKGWQGWLLSGIVNSEENNEDDSNHHPYQSRVFHAQGQWILFAPSGSSPTAFDLYRNRIMSGESADEYRFFLVFESLHSIDLEGVLLHQFNFFRSNLTGANLSGANVGNAYLHGVRLNIADLSNASLINADLSCANLSGADLSGADLTRADLSEANLIGADLSGADLSGADLTRACCQSIQRIVAAR